MRILLKLPVKKKEKKKGGASKDLKNYYRLAPRGFSTYAMYSYYKDYVVFIRNSGWIPQNNNLRLTTFF